MVAVGFALDDRRGNRVVVVGRLWLLPVHLGIARAATRIREALRQADLSA